MLGSHLIKSWSSAQASVSLSSSKAEYYGVVKASSYALGYRLLSNDLDICLPCRVWIDSSEVNMTITEYKLLGHMIGKNNALCSRGELLEHVWELPPTLNTRTVDTHVKRLRQKMGPIADYIQTVRGAGYRFFVPENDQ